MPFDVTPRGSVMFPTGADVLLVELLLREQVHVLAQAVVVVQRGRSVCLGYDPAGTVRLYRRLRQARRHHRYAFQWRALRAEEPAGVMARVQLSPLLKQPLSG
jgi:hypothetical protein